MNPIKYAFRVSSGHFLEFVVYTEGINTDNDKTQAITNMKTLMNITKLKKFPW